MELGFDLSALSDRVGLEVTAYRARTRDALIAVSYPPSEGFIQNQLENVGTLENRGYELQLSGTPLRTDLLNWTARVNYSAMSSKAIDLGGRDIAVGLGARVKEGYPVPTVFGARITNPDANADPIVALDQPIGTVYPTHILGVGTTLTLRGDLTFDILGEYQGGGHLQNWIGYQNTIRFMWYPCYDIQKKMIAGTSLDGYTAQERGKCAYSAANRNADYWIEPTDFFKIRSASLSYRLPQRFTPKVKSAMLILAGRNLWKSTKYDGLDPEMSDTQDAGGGLGRREYYQLPPSKQFMLSLRATF
jgi:hypothetical protein